LKKNTRKRLALKDYFQGIINGDKVILAQAITLAESRLKSDSVLAEKLVAKLIPLKNVSIRLGITGSPGVGKSTFIEAFGKYLTELGKKVAVLAIDPSSTKTKGSILGDKTRMEELSKDPLAFIRPTSTGNALGGVANRTREAVLLCEAAGFDVIIIETVGVGQSETAVRNMVDFFLLLMLAGSGDELQGIKKGIMEMADGIVVTKADGENLKKATQAQADFTHALHLFQLPESNWQARVLTASAIEKKGIAETWEMINDYLAFTQSNKFLQRNRQLQQLTWFQENFELALKESLRKNVSIQKEKEKLERKILANEITPLHASKALFKKFLSAGNRG